MTPDPEIVWEAPKPRSARLRRALLVINTKSRQGGEVTGAATAALQQCGIDLLQQDCLNACALCATIRRLTSSVDMVVLGGGDGTMNSAARALIETGLPLGILPLGTVNDLARTRGIRLNLEGAAQVVI